MSTKGSYPVSEGSEVSWSEFVARDLPTDLREEIALQRTLLRDTMAAIRTKSEDEIGEIVNQVGRDLESTLTALGVDAANIVVISKAFREKVRPTLAQAVPQKPDAKLLGVLQKTVASIAMTAERMERIQRGRKIKVLIDLSTISWIIRTYILKFVPKERRPALVAEMRKNLVEAEGIADE